MPRRLSGNRSKQPRNDPSSESSIRTHTRNPIPGLLRIRFLPRHDVSPSAVAFQTHRRSCNRDSIALRTAAFLSDELRLDGVIDYKAENDLAASIGRACPDGIDLYFDNVGGPTLDAALLHLREAARVVLCGRISQAVADQPYGIRNLGQLLSRHGRM